MLVTTNGIVLHSIKYSESSCIVRIYTEFSGLQSFLFKGVYGPRSKIKQGLFQPLTLLELVSYVRKKSTLHIAKEVRIAHPYHSLPFEISKSSVALFINELVFKSVKEEETNHILFDFLWNSCILLDECAGPISHFHLAFSAEMTRFLGIHPLLNYNQSRPVFNLKEGQFQAIIPDKDPFIIPEYGKAFSDLMATDLKDHSKLRFKPSVRRSLLESMLQYYQIHIPGFKPMNSHHILHSVLS